MICVTYDEVMLLQEAISVVMEACLWSFYGGWIFELQWGPLMVIFHHGDAAEDKGKEAHENPRAFPWIFDPIYLESSIQCPCGVGLHQVVLHQNDLLQYESFLN
ncbi:hypothetical protein HKD37_05G012797 [Glycine soja]